MRFLGFIFYESRLQHLTRPYCLFTSREETHCFSTACRFWLDRDYFQLILWDPEELEIAGAYRIGEAGKLNSDPNIKTEKVWITYGAELVHLSNDTLTTDICLEAYLSVACMVKKPAQGY